MLKIEGLPAKELAAEELELVIGGVLGGVEPIVVIKPPGEPADTTCGTKGPGYVPVRW
jgi:hypothetical protein